MSGMIGSELLRRCVMAAGLLVVSLTFGERAEAACSPAMPADGGVVTCSGTTVNQNDPIGYDFTANDGTINVLSGASVTGTDSAIDVEHRGTVNNAGSIAGSRGVFSDIATIINNSGSIVGTANSGVFSLASGDVNNSGTISGATNGINVHNGAIVNLSGGTITGAIYGVSIDDVATASNAGIFGGTTALHFLSINEITSELTNSGTLSSSSDAAVFAGGGLNANNTGFISGMLGISVAKNATIFNAGTIEGITSGVTAQNATIDNTGTIQSLGANSIAIGVTGTLTLNNSGLVRANQSNGEGVSGTTVNVINSGVIEATGANGIAIGATNTIVNNSGTIRGGKFGVAAGNTANITNSGLIQAGVRDYWARQWGMVNPNVQPKNFATRPNGTVEVDVQQRVRDLNGDLLSDKIVRHIFEIENGLIKRFDIG